MHFQEQTDCNTGRRGRRRGRFAAGMMAAGFGRGFGRGADDGFGRGADDGMGGRRGRRGRVLDGEALQLVLLHLLSGGPDHGYALIQAVEGLSGGHYAPSPGVLYPMLTLMADMGLIAEQPGEGNRRAFAITEAGMARLAAERDSADAALVRLRALAEAHQGRDSGPVARAMMNLGAVLASRARSGGLDRATALTAAQIIDAAASEIERL